jgi:hypothetical protein
MLNIGQYCRSGLQNSHSGDGEVRTSSVSSLAACGSWFIYQDSENYLQSLWWDSNKALWRPYSLDKLALAGTQLSMIPLYTNSTEINRLGRFAIISQGEDGQLVGSTNPTSGRNPETPELAADEVFKFSDGDGDKFTGNPRRFCLTWVH